MPEVTRESRSQFYAEPEKPFYFNDGTKVSSVFELASKIHAISDTTFESYVNNYKNDFAFWIRNAIRNNELADRIETATKRWRMIDAIDSYIKELNSETQKQNHYTQQTQQESYYTQQEQRYDEPPAKQQISEYQPSQQTTRYPNQPRQGYAAAPASKKDDFEQKQDDTRQWDNIQTPEQQNQKRYETTEDNYTSPISGQPRNQERTADTGFASYVEKKDRKQQEQKSSTIKNLAKEIEEKYSQRDSSNEQALPDMKDDLPIEKESKYKQQMQEPQLRNVNSASWNEPAQQTEQFSQKKKDDENMLSEAEVKRFADTLQNLKSEISKVIIGQDDIVERILLTMMCDAHALLEGVPGLAKSLLVEVLARVIGKSSESLSGMDSTTFRRIQFLPDMLPSDVIGGQIYNPKSAEFVTVKGPIFANFVLADEINRAPPKTHAALMEAMQEKKINIDKDTFILDRPFLVLATQNPLENKGTYSLPEAVLDRFMFKINLEYPNRKDEIRIISENATINPDVVKTSVNYVMTKEEFLNLQASVKKVFISDRIKEYILDIVEATRGLNKNIEGYKFVKYGAGVRASIYLGIGAKARAIMQGRNYVMPHDVVFVTKDILRHRVALNFKGKAHNISPDKIIEEILSKVNAV